MNHEQVMRQALEPYCYVYEYDTALGMHRALYPKTYNGKQPDRAIALYTTPPQRKPLTDEEIRSMCKQPWVFEAVMQWVRVIEKAHGIGE